MGRYAQQTTVSAERSRAEIEEVLRRYGAEQFMSGWEASRAMIGFRCYGRQVRFVLHLPNRNDPEFKRTEKRHQLRSPEEAQRAWEQACRQRWRALCLCIKAKLESVESGIETFEEAFLPHIVLPGNVTVGDHLIPEIGKAYETGELPRLLPMLPPPRTEQTG